VREDCSGLKKRKIPPRARSKALPECVYELLLPHWTNVLCGDDWKRSKVKLGYATWTLQGGRSPTSVCLAVSRAPLLAKPVERRTYTPNRVAWKPTLYFAWRCCGRTATRTVENLSRVPFLKARDLRLQWSRSSHGSVIQNTGSRDSIRVHHCPSRGRSACLGLQLIHPNTK
jgi:hypothetical protein